MKFLRLRNIIFFILSFILITFSYINFEEITASFDNKLREMFFEYRGEIQTSKNVVIVDIDEKSIKALGQWPFSRDKIAQVLINLTNSNVGVIGLDIIFSEPDRNSPELMAKLLNVKGEFQNNDQLFGQVLANTPTILGYFFTQENEYKDLEAPNIPANFILESKNFSKLINAQGVVKNTKLIQDYAYSSGFFNAYSSLHGKITKMPLLLSYKNEIYPSLSLEMIRAALQSEDVHIHEDEFGIIGISLNDLFIPTNEEGFMSINFRGAKKSFKYLSFIDILNGNFNSKDVEGKLVLLGTSAITLADLRASVYDLAMPGVEIHANVLDNIIQGDFLYEHNSSVAINTLAIFILTVILGIIYLFLNSTFTLVFFALILGSFVSLYYNILFTQGLILNIFFPLLAIFLTTFIALLLNYSKEQEQKKIITDKFSKKVSPAVVSDLLNRKDDGLKASKKEVSIFFSDIRGFTNLSEQIDDPEELIKILNLYMEPMSEEIIKTNGTIDKFIGDAIMAYWNAPQNIPNHPICAVNTALNQLEKLEVLNKKLKNDYGFVLDIGIGIHTGVVTVGEMGSKGRSDYTIIGDNVNLASRVESLTKFFDAKIIITEDLKKYLDESFILKKLAQVSVKGKSNSITLYELISTKDNLSKSYEKYLEAYKLALKTYENQDFKKAKNYFLEANKLKDLNVHDFYINACDKYLNEEKEFSLVFNMEHK